MPSFDPRKTSSLSGTLHVGKLLSVGKSTCRQELEGSDDLPVKDYFNMPSTSKKLQVF
jgi:hypothetical protein